MAYQVGQNHTRTCWILKCDIRKFFASINHGILLEILREYIQDENVIWLLQAVIQSFGNSTSPLPPPLHLPLGQGERVRRTKGERELGGRGLPLGNLTSQLFCNVYMNEFDQFVKHKLKAKFYLRYADDFVLLSRGKARPPDQIYKIKEFLSEHLKLDLQPDKIDIKTAASGIDYLGWVNFPTHRVLRTTTKRRMRKRLAESPKQETLASYLGLLNHGNTFKLKQEVLNFYGLQDSLFY